jgi:hypothetical protein
MSALYFPKTEREGGRGAQYVIKTQTLEILRTYILCTGGVSFAYYIKLLIFKLFCTKGFSESRHPTVLLVE